MVAKSLMYLALYCAIPRNETTKTRSSVLWIRRDVLTREDPSKELDLHLPEFTFLQVGRQPSRLEIMQYIVYWFVVRTLVNTKDCDVITDVNVARHTVYDSLNLMLKHFCCRTDSQEKSLETRQAYVC